MAIEVVEFCCLLLYLKEENKNDEGKDMDKFQQCFNVSLNEGTLVL